jgi:hypothetical protein
MISILGNDVACHKGNKTTHSRKFGFREGVHLLAFKYQEELFVVRSLLCLLAYMPQANQFCSIHAVNSNHPCCFCTTSCKCQNVIDLEANMWVKEEVTDLLKKGTKNALQEQGLKWCDSPLWELPTFDPYKHVPMELLYFVVA